MAQAHFAQQCSALDHFLYRLQGAYRDPTRTRNEIIELLRHHPALQPRAGPLANKKGAEQCVYLSGTIPVTYNGASYNIPVSIWVPLAFPAVPPVAFVTPTPDMIVKPRHRHVDSAGMTYLPYLSSWSSKSSSLRELVATMCKVFSQDPPVRAKPKDRAASSGSKSASPTAQTKTSSSGKSFEDPGAVIKRNAIHAVTEKLRRELKNTYTELAKEIDKLMTASTVDPLARKQQELRKVRGEVEATQSKLDELTRWLATNDTGGDIDIDAITEPRDALSKQLLHLVAQDASYEDLGYYMEKALMQGSLELADFLKAYRAAARHQAMCRALMKRVHQVQRENKQASK